jgi:hypothetical protein
MVGSTARQFLVHGGRVRARGSTSLRLEDRPPDPTNVSAQAVPKSVGLSWSDRACWQRGTAELWAQHEPGFTGHGR